MGDVSLDYVAPDETAKDYVSVFYNFRSTFPVFEDDERADLAQLRFMFEGAGFYRFADGHEQVAPEIQIVGPTTGVNRVRVEGYTEVFGAGLLPAGWGAIIGVNASSLLNRVIDATELLGRDLYEVRDALRAAPTLEARAAIGNMLIADLVARNHEATPRWFTSTVDAWLSSDPNPDVDELVRRTGLSRRQVERHCNRLYGAPPKLLARKYRALRAAVMLAKGEASPAELVDRGFYDQSHCIREIKRFTGITPQRIIGDLPELTRLTLKRTEFAGRLAPIVSDT